MEIIRIPGYTEWEKLHIAKKYLLKKQREANGLSEHNIDCPESALMTVIRSYTRESGVRSLEREIGALCRKVAVEVVKKDRSARIRITSKGLAKYLGPARYRINKAEQEDKIGVVTGLAWTDMGGELLATEVTVVPGKGKLTITGKIGDVMQESAQAAMSYVRSRADELGLEKDFYQQVDIHVHIPEGAIPKDGPSAGVTMATCLVSALAKIPVRHVVAMTGEITLRGRVLPIGGLKEKILAAHRGGIKEVIIPLENEKDLQEVPATILREVKIKTVEHMDDVLRQALLLPDPNAFLVKKEQNLQKTTLYPTEPQETSSAEIVAH
jgi:ATP-dependent Lon protease